ncbi:hybrid sensor histidine kinase/response regulator [Roseivivax isoporae]|uniref:histidine kinase n=1 Tax=Roseivivax isoporae LMG 25204 TaxID=1449351 RepID=X7F7E1_9RHOB|nr:hybrid sensor histidine kinase/response regulator [Roseivivax isoporae]ETX28847.1 hypothetical protein RISW2_04910 [Roseivivax isoporae LMG 25204]
MADHPSSTPPAKADEDHQSFRLALQIIARLIATDRRAVLFASESGEILLINAPAKRLGLDTATLHDQLRWPQLCARTRRAGSAPVSTSIGDMAVEGELVHLALGRASGYFLRLSETDAESTWLRNRARAATLLRVAHDLRTPIQSLVATAEVLVRDNGDGSQETAALARFRRAADLSLEHVSNVLAVIKGEQAAGGLQPDEAFAPAGELASLIEILRPLAEARDATLRVSAPDGLERLVGPVRFVRALFQNMIDNSVKHGGSEIDVTLTLAPLKDTLDADGAEARMGVTLEVADLGGGLPDAQKRRLKVALGEAQAQAVPSSTDTSARQRPSGGLNVLAHALRQLGGRLEIEDRHGGPGGDGTVIGTRLRATFSLPRAAEDAVTPDVPEAAVRHAPPLLDANMLVVEDSAASQEWVAHVLRRAGATVHVAGSGAEALDFLGSEDARAVSLVLSDVTLPRMTGVELAHRIRDGVRSGRFAAGLRVVGLTAHVDDRIRDACHRAGMVKVLEKPIRPLQLCDALHQILKQAPLPAPQQLESPPALQDAGDSFDPQVVSELGSELGREGAVRFMTRALNEAEAALDRLRAEGVTDRSGCMLHAATGACGLTGLTRVERHLRALEDRVKAGGDPGAATLTDLAAVIEDTRAAVVAWAG